MQDIYAKIQMAEEYLRNLRITLQATEKVYESSGKMTSTLAAVTMPFVNSACASARAAAMSAGVRN